MRLPLLVIALLSTAVRADIDLTPVVASTKFGGFSASRLQFTDGTKKFAMSLDSDAEVVAAEGGTGVRFKGIPQASVVFRRSPLTAAVAFDAEGLARYQKAALQLLPASAESVVQDEAVADAESIGGGHSYRFTFSYEIAKAPMRESIIFLNIDAAQQIVVQTGAFAKDFEATAGRANSMIRGWHEMTPGEEKGEN